MLTFQVCSVHSIVQLPVENPWLHKVMPCLLSVKKKSFCSAIRSSERNSCPIRWGQIPFKGVSFHLILQLHVHEKVMNIYLILGENWKCSIRNYLAPLYTPFYITPTVYIVRERYQKGSNSFGNSIWIILTSQWFHEIFTNFRLIHGLFNSTKETSINDVRF